MATSGCVRATVIDGATNRYRMVVVEPCVFDRIEASHAMSLFDIDQKYGDVVGLDVALSLFEENSR
jgi:nicotinamidase-related amidase